jgi:hypothetical protein
MFRADNADQTDIVVVVPLHSSVAKRVLGAVAAAAPAASAVGSETYRAHSSELDE